MKPPSFDDIFDVLSAAAVGDTAARVPLGDVQDGDDEATRLAIALNVLLDDLAHSASEAKRELEERGRLAHRLQGLADASREFAATTGDLRELLDVIARRLGALVGDICFIRPVSADGEWLESGGAVYHSDPELLAVAQEVARLDRQRVGEGISGRVAARKEPELVPVAVTEALIAGLEPRYRSLLERLNVSTMMTIPLLCRDRLVGIANLMRSGRPYTEEDLHVVRTVADHAAIAIDKARSFAAERAARTAAEEARQESRVAEERYRLIFERSPLPKWVYDVATLEIIDVNAAAVRDYGFARDELLRMTIRDLRPPEAVHELLESLSPPSQEASFGLWQHRRKNGEVFRAEVTTHNVTLAGRLCRLAIARDATERLRLEDQLRQSQKMEAVGRLAGGIAHDFNNMLSVILSYGDHLLTAMRPGEPMRADVEEIKKAGQRAATLTRQLLMFSRQQVLEPRIVDLNEVLTSMDAMLQRILGADIDLVSSPSPDLGRVRVDRSCMEQVIMNLVVNARDAMPTGGKLTMETRNVSLDEAYEHSHVDVTRGAYVMLAVTDTGVGMDAATLSRIFEPFFTTKETGKGTGLGLSTVFGIAKQSGGSVWVYSEPGKGTTFKVYLPRVDGPVEKQRSGEHRLAIRGTETILLVEDDEQVRTLARTILRRVGYHVIEAANAGEALLHCEKHPGVIHLLLSDVVMPQMSGPELATRLSAIRPEMKTLCMSGYTDDSIVRHGVLKAQIAFLQKPFTPGALTTRVREVLDGNAPEPVPG